MEPKHIDDVLASYGMGWKGFMFKRFVHGMVAFVLGVVVAKGIQILVLPNL